MFFKRIAAAPMFYVAFLKFISISYVNQLNIRVNQKGRATFLPDKNGWTPDMFHYLVIIDTHLLED